MTSSAAFLEGFSVEAVVPALQASSKSDVLAEMVQQAVAAKVLPKARKAQVLQALEEREERGSTGLGRGIAIPHAKIGGLRRHAGVVARSIEGVDFRAIDGEPVYVLVMLISPASRDQEHLAALRWVSTVARDPDFTSFIRQARTAEDILEVLRERAG